MKKVFIVIVALCMGLSCLTNVANAYVARFEAEWADQLDPPMFVTDDDNADGITSNGLLIRSPHNGDSNSNPGNNGTRYDFWVPAGGVYKLVIRSNVRDGDNSFWTTIQGPGTITYAGGNIGHNQHGSNWWRNNGLKGNGWHWINSWNDDGTDAIVKITLSEAGVYTVRLTHREGGCRMDTFIVTDDLVRYPDNAGSGFKEPIPMDMHYASNPAPGWDAKAQAFSGLKLTWEAPVEALGTETTYNVYFGDSLETASSNLIATVPAAGPLEVDLDTAVGALAASTTYHWRVDTVTGIFDPVCTGMTMKFGTLTNDPVVGQLANGGAWTGDPVTFSIDAISGDLDDQGLLSYQWCDAFDDSDITGEISADLTLTAGSDDVGVYCKVTNANNTIQSNTATLHVHKHVGHWTFDEGAGSIAYDTSPNDAINGLRTTAMPNDAYIIAPDAEAIWTAGGMIGGAIELSRNNEYLDTFKRPSTLGIGGNNARTFSTWVFTKGFNNGGVYDMGRDSNTQDFCLRTLGGDNRWRLQYWGGDWSFNTMNRTQDQHMNMITSDDGHFPSKDAWVHFVHTHDASGTNVYANGVHIINWGGKGLNTTDRYTLKIGSYRNRDGRNGTEFVGIIDDMQAFNYALTHEEAVALYKQGVPDARICLTSNSADTDNDCDVDINDLAAVVGNNLATGIVP